MAGAVDRSARLAAAWFGLAGLRGRLDGLRHDPAGRHLVPRCPAPVMYKPISRSSSASSLSPDEVTSDADTRIDPQRIRDAPGAHDGLAQALDAVEGRQVGADRNGLDPVSGERPRR